MAGQRQTTRLYRLITGMKTADAGIQFLCYLALTGIFMDSNSGAGLPCLTVLAGFQCLSAIFWLFVLHEGILKMNGATGIRLVFVVLMVFITLGWYIGTTLVALVLLGMLIIIALICSILYFVATIFEIAFYIRPSKAKIIS